MVYHLCMYIVQQTELHVGLSAAVVLSIRLKIVENMIHHILILFLIYTFLVSVSYCDFPLATSPFFS
jgi:hypothetical protein